MINRIFDNTRNHQEDYATFKQQYSHLRSVESLRTIVRADCAQHSKESQSHRWSKRAHSWKSDEFVISTSVRIPKPSFHDNR